MSYTIALPKGSHIEQEVLEILAKSGVKVIREDPREIRCKVDGLGDVSHAIFCKREQVMQFLHGGSAIFGIMGKDTVLEEGSDHIEIVGEFASTQTRGVLFTRRDNPVSTWEEFRAQSNMREGEFPPIIVSEYPRQTHAFFNTYGLWRRIVDCKSAETILCAEPQYLYGVALVETGTTLAVNGLKEVVGATIFESCVVLVGRKDAPPQLRSTMLGWVGAGGWVLPPGIAR